MANFHLGWRILAALAMLSVGSSLNSVNLDLKTLSQIDLSALGTPNLNNYKMTYDVTVDSNCQYILLIEFEKPADQIPGNASPDFQGVCQQSGNTGNAPDGQPWHATRRYWMQFPSYVSDTTGFDHMSIYWRPCGLPPLGLRKSRFDVTFYNVIPQYRAFWTCSEVGIPRTCSPNQTSTLGRAQFVIPCLERDPTFLANLPVGFEPDPTAPAAYQYEGLFSWNIDAVPKIASNFTLPQFDLSTYDGNAVAWRLMMPWSYVSGPNSTASSAHDYYVYQTLPQLPASWNTTYDAGSGKITVSLGGSAGMCGAGFASAKAQQQGKPSRTLRS